MGNTCPIKHGVLSGGIIDNQLCFHISVIATQLKAPFIGNFTVSRHLDFHMKYHKNGSCSDIVLMKVPTKFPMKP